MEANLQQSKQSKLTKKVQTLELENGEHKLGQSQAVFKQAHPCRWPRNIPHGGE